MTGLHLSHYAIESELGRGGMGVVFLATDTKLNRKVALKVLPASALASPDDRARFQREAQSAAQLNHPNVCHVYQVDEAVPKAPDGGAVEGHMESRLFIAMEYIEGETLHDYVRRGPLKLQEAVNIAGQVAEALKEAHSKDIVHRDIKSANIMLTEGGVAKVLDFGLAKTNQSTMLTRMGSTLGTVAYMSPEQARGQEVDGRSDLYSLGTLLYEMVAGRLPYTGDYEQAVLYGILNEAPDPLTALRTGVPMQLEWIVDKLLKKEAEYRYQSAAGLLADLKSLDLSGSGRTQRISTGTVAVPTGKAVLPTWIWGAVAGALVVGALGAWVLKPDAPPAEEPVVRFELEADQPLARTGRHSIAISPDGRLLATVDPDGVRLRRLDQIEESTLLVPGGDAREISFSPDSRWIVFEQTDDDWLMRLEAGGGAPTRIADLPGATYGVSWAEDGMIYIGLGIRGMARVPASGGVLEVIVPGDSLGAFHGPRLLPDGQTLVYTYTTEDWDEGEIRLLDLGSGLSRTIYSGGRDARYVATGHLLFLWEGSLYALRYDAGRNEVIGGPVPVAGQIDDAATTTGAGHFDLSRNGTFVSSRASSDRGTRVLTWLSPDGSTQPVLPDIREWSHVGISPDGLQIVAQVTTGGLGEVVVLDALRGITTTMSLGETAWAPIWDSAGGRIAYVSLGGDPNLVVQHVADPSRIDTLFRGFAFPSSWSSDGRLIAYVDGPRLANDLRILDVESGASTPFLVTAADTDYPVISPDGRWIAYDEGSFRDEQVLIRRLDTGGNLQQVSESRGSRPQWSVDGETIYYASAEGILARGFHPDTGVMSAERRVPTPSGFLPRVGFAVHPDGRILVVVGTDEVGEEESTNIIDVTINFDTELRSRVPEGQ